MITDYSKQSTLIDSNKVNNRINVLGCGATGSWVVLFLLKMGFKNIHVYDFDVIEEHNIPNQLFRETDINKPKVEAMLEIYKEFFDDVDDRVHIHNDKITSINAVGLRDIVLNCVDSMKCRKTVYEKAFKYGHAEFLCESRLSVWGAYIFTLRKDGKNVNSEYEETLYDDEEAEVSSCGVSQTGLPAAVNAASMIIMQMICYLRGEDTLWKVQYSIPDMVTMVA